MRWKYNFLFLVFFLFLNACEKSSSSEKHFKNKIPTTQASSKSCALNLVDTHDVVIKTRGKSIYVELTACEGSFILDNLKSDIPNTCTFELHGPCVSPDNIFSRYGDRDQGKIKKEICGDHIVSVTYTVPGKSYGLISVEPAVKAPDNPFLFKNGSLEFKLSQVAFLRVENGIPVFRSLAPNGSLKIANSSDKSRSFHLLLENLSDTLSRIEHSGLSSMEEKKQGKLRYLLQGTIPGNSNASIEVLQRPLSQPWSFAFGGDVKHEISVFLQLLEQLLLKENPLFIIEAGDYTRNSLPGELHEYFERTAWLPIPVYYVKGNHEIRVQGQKHYQRLFGPARYSFTVGQSLFVILDSTDYATSGKETGFRLGSKQLRWLDKVLESHKEYRYSFIFLHTPPSPLHGPSLRPSYPSNMTPSETQALMDLSKKHLLSYVLSGHAHIYARKKIGCTIYLTSGAGGAKLHTYNKLSGFDIDTRKHLMVFEVTNSGIKEKRVFLPREEK